MELAITIIVSYCLGSIPFAYIIVKLFGGKDIREVGSGNVGGMNTARNIGLLPGIIVVCLDLCKSMSAVYVFGLFGEFYYSLAAGLMVVAGHNWPIFLAFRGGKGIAASIGAGILLFPLFLLYTYLVIGLAWILSRNPSLSIVIGYSFFPIWVIFVDFQPTLLFWAIIFSLIIIIKHLPDISLQIKQ